MPGHCCTSNHELAPAGIRRPLLTLRCPLPCTDKQKPASSLAFADENDDSPTPGCSVFKQLSTMFNAAYSGNRGPVSVGVHTPYLQTRCAQQLPCSALLCPALAIDFLMAWGQLLAWTGQTLGTVGRLAGGSRRPVTP
jgi:hypothetical protein